MSPAELRRYHKPRTVTEPCKHDDTLTPDICGPECGGPRNIVICSACDETWPCDVADLLEQVEYLSGQNAELRYLHRFACLLAAGQPGELAALITATLTDLTPQPGDATDTHGGDWPEHLHRHQTAVHTG